MLTGDKVPESRASRIEGGRTGRGPDIEGLAPPGEPSGPISVTGTELAGCHRNTTHVLEWSCSRCGYQRRPSPRRARASPTRPRGTGSDGPRAPGLCTGWGHEPPAAGGCRSVSPVTVMPPVTIMPPVTVTHPVTVTCPVIANAPGGCRCPHLRDAPPVRPVESPSPWAAHAPQPAPPAPHPAPPGPRRPPHAGNLTFHHSRA